MVSSRPLVLYVEDNPGDIALMRKALEVVGSKIDLLSVADAAAAVSYLESAKISKLRLPRLILIDLLMPDCNGLDLVETIKFDRRWRKIPIVVVTVSPTDENRRRAQVLNVDALVPKPQSWNRYMEFALNIANFVLLE